MESFGLALALAALTPVTADPAKEANVYPYIVSIHRNNPRRNFICAGSLIATSWVLTSANCLPKIAYKIRYGDMMAVNDSTYSLILNRIHHMNSKSLHLEAGPDRLTPKTNNIALALIEKIPFMQLGLLSANDYFSILGHEVKFFEFGFLPVFKARIYGNKNRIFTYPNKNKFQKSNNIKESFDNSSGFNPNDTKVRTGSGVAITCPNRDYPGPNICVAKKCFDFDANNPRDLLVTPDYGAPLVYDKRIVGVTSEVEHYYSSFTPVSPYLDWIRDQMKEEVYRRVKV